MRCRATGCITSAPSATSGKTFPPHSLTGTQPASTKPTWPAASITPDRGDAGRAEEREKEEANSPEASPGLHLPGSGGVFLFDQFQGKPELAEIIQNGSDLNENAKKGGLRGKINPMAGTHPIELKGAHAPLQSHIPRPTIYVDIDEGAPTDTPLGDRFKLVRAEVRNNVRVIASLKMALSGKVTEQRTFVPIAVEKMGTGAWVKITPSADLAPGEYAVVEMLDDNEMNLYVWDFGVNPKAPANPNTWQPAASAQSTEK